MGHDGHRVQRTLHAPWLNGHLWSLGIRSIWYVNAPVRDLGWFLTDWLLAHVGKRCGHARAEALLNRSQHFCVEDG